MSSTVSPPLPLPLQFALLPSSSPTKTLIPLLYIMVNDLPIYLTLDSSRPPSLSLLPLLLALNPMPPVHILSHFHLSASLVSVDMDGMAPFVDFWVPIEAARRVVKQLRCDRLFFDDKGRGLLGRSIGEMVSWDDGGAIGHNWLPNTSAIPPSGYSLQALLTTPFTTTTLIPDDRCLTTPIDSARRAHILRQAEFEDPSRIRFGQWGHAWDALLRLTIISWADFQAYPSSPLIDKRSIRFLPAQTPELVRELLLSLPSTSKHTFTPPLADLQALLRPPPLDASPGLVDVFRLIGTYLIEVLHRLITLPRWAPGWLRRRKYEGDSRATVRTRERYARTQMGAVEGVSGVMISSWRMEREIQSLRMGSETDMRTAPGQRSSSAGSDRPKNSRKIRSGGRKREAYKDHMRASSESEGLDREEILDEMERLERRRGGSPPPRSPIPSPVDGNAVARRRERSESAQTIRPEDIHRNMNGLKRQSEARRPNSAFRRRSSSRRSVRSQVIDSGDEEEEVAEGENEDPMAHELSVRGAAHALVDYPLKSDEVGGWWIYMGVMVFAMLAAGFGFVPLV